MPEEINITEYYSVSCRPYDAEGDGVSLLERARREFFARGGAKGSVRSVENGQEVHTRYRLGAKRFRWKKVCGRVTLQEAFAVADGCFRLVTHSPSGELLSAHTYDAGLCWLQTAYFDGDPRQPAAVLKRRDGGLAVCRPGGGCAESLLLPCPWEPGTAAQSFVNAAAGEPLVVARTNAGTFCFCPEEERALRLSLREQAAGKAPVWPGEESAETLDFRVVPNAPTDEGGGHGGANAQAVPAGAENLPGRGAEPRTAQRGEHPAKGTSAPSYAANHEIFASPPLKGSPSPRRQHARYAVAAKGLSGGIRNRLSLQSLPAVQNGENRSPRLAGEPLDAPGGIRNRLSLQSRPAVQNGENDGLNLAGELVDAPGVQTGPAFNVQEDPKSGRSPQGCWGVPEVQGEQNGSAPDRSLFAPPARFAQLSRSESCNPSPGGVTPQTRPAVQPSENQSPRLAGEPLDAPGSSGSIPKHSRQTGPSDSSGRNGGESAQAQPVIPAKRIVVSSLESYLYFGRLLNGLRQGRGRTAMADGRTAYEGGYRDDMRDGFGVYYYKSGELCYAGEWRRNLRDGLGVAFGAKDGSVFVGNWENGSATGPGSEFDLSGNLTYTGGWKDGRRHGYGTEYRNGRVWRCGVWRDDVFSTDGTPSGHGLP